MCDADNQSKRHGNGGMGELFQAINSNLDKIGDKTWETGLRADLDRLYMCYP
jgi:hypothetical protein